MAAALLVLTPNKDDPSLADDPQRNNNFNYAKMDPHGYAVLASYSPDESA
jgi:hypothetical protein